MLPRHLGLVHTRYLFEVERYGDPFEAPTVLQRGTLPPAVGTVDDVRDGVAVFHVSVVAHLHSKPEEKRKISEFSDLIKKERPQGSVDVASGLRLGEISKEAR